MNEELPFETGSLQGDLARAAELTRQGTQRATAAAVAPTPSPVAEPALRTARLETPRTTTIPATSLAQQITSGDLSGIMAQNQELLRQQLAAFQPSPERRAVAEQLNRALERQRALTSEQVTRAADLRLQGAEVGQPIVGRQLAALQSEVGIRELPIAQEIASLTDRLRLFEEERQNTVQQLNILAQQGQFNANLAARFNEIVRNEQTEARKLAREYGVTTPFYIEGGTVYRTSDGRPYSSEEQFFNDPQVRAQGITSFGQAYNTGVLSDLGPSIAQRIEQEKTSFDRQIALQRLGLEQDKFLWEMQKQDTQIVDIGGGVKALVDQNTGNIIRELKPQEKAFDPIAMAQGKEKVNRVNSVLTSGALGSLVGPNNYARLGLKATLIGETGNFLSSVKQILDELTVDKLTQAKQQGATFGALTDGEREVLASAASKLSAVIAKDRQGNIVGYNISEKAFKEELDKIALYAKMDYALKGGNPQDVGITVTPDGKLFTPNSQGQLVELEELYGRLPTATGLPSFNQAGNASDSTVKAYRSSIQKMPMLKFENTTKPLVQAFPQGTYGGQCGVWVRRVVERQGLTYPTVGNTIGEKASAVKRYGVPQSQARPGSVVITNENKNTGHVAYIVGQNAQGWVLAESNYGLDERVRYGRVLPYNSPSIIGYINPKKA